MEQNITMESGIELDGVEIVREMPVSMEILLFTIQIRLKQAKSASLKMCLKLPGFEVMADGQVQVEGKKVVKLFVNGKPFMEGDTS
jgi:hypothetical protein